MSAAAAVQQAAKDAAGPFHSWENFLNLHKTQFEAMKLPKYLWKNVHKKLYSQHFIEKENAFEVKHLGEGSFDLRATVPQRKWGDVFIIPHIFVGTKANIIKQLRENKEIVDRLWKLMDLDALVIQEKPVEKKASAIESVSVPPNARPAPVFQPADPDMIDMIVEQTGCSKERAAQALEVAQNDLVEALNNCESHPELREMEESVNQFLGGKYGNVEVPTGASTESSTAASTETPVLTEEEKYEQRIHTVYSAMFSLNYVSAYMVMEPRALNSKITGPPRPEEIVMRYFVMDEFGSAIQFSKTPNVIVHPFVCLTHNNAGYTLMWAEENIAAGQSLLRPPVAKVPMP